MEVKSELVIAYYQRRVAELEMEKAILTAQVQTLQGGASEADLPVPPLEGNDERPAPDRIQSVG